MTTSVLQLDPQNATAHRLAGRPYGFLGREREAYAHAKHALELNPYDGDYGMILIQMGACFWADDDARASQELDKCESVFLANYHYVALALLQRTGQSEALTNRISEMTRERPGTSIRDAQMLYLHYKDRDAVDRMLDLLRQTNLAAVASN